MQASELCKVEVKNGHITITCQYDFKFKNKYVNIDIPLNGKSVTLNLVVVFLFVASIATIGIGTYAIPGTAEVLTTTIRYMWSALLATLSFYAWYTLIYTIGIRVQYKIIEPLTTHPFIKLSLSILSVFALAIITTAAAMQLTNFQLNPLFWAINYAFKNFEPEILFTLPWKYNPEVTNLYPTISYGWFYLSLFFSSCVALDTTINAMNQLIHKTK